MQHTDGYTLMELLITIAIVAVVATLVSPALDSWSNRKSYKNTYKQIRDELVETRHEALTRNTTGRMVLAENSGTYTITSYYSASPTTTCTTAGSWTQIDSFTVDVPDAYQISGTGMANTCFYRDGSASGGSFSITPVDSSSGLDSATITVTMSTGYLDVSE